MRASFDCTVDELTEADGVKRELDSQTEATVTIREDCQMLVVVGTVQVVTPHTSRLPHSWLTIVLE
jgi:NAD-dependent SIR2 family protein deacetylase